MEKSMVVQHNMQALNANRLLGITTGQATHATEKLSSGYKINRAADNAAGLAISEKMRKQMRGLTQASTNAEDGVSCVQTAEGALAEIQDMLQRMNELCVQAANGTNSITDRQYIQDEIDELVTEIDRVSETTKFNELYLLKGDEAEKGTYNQYTMDYQLKPVKSLLPSANQATLKSPATSEFVYNYIGKQNTYFVKKADLDNVVADKKLDMSVISTDVVKTGDDVSQYLIPDASALIGGDDEVITFQNNIWDANTLVDKDTMQAKKNTLLFDMETETIVFIRENISLAGDNKYIDDDGQLLDRYRYLGEDTDIYKFKAEPDVTKTDDETDIRVQKAKCKLYDADGEEVAGMALYKYYDDNGNYKGGLFTKPVADATSKVEAGDTATNKITDYVNVLATKVANDLEFSIHVGADGTKENKIETVIQSISAAGIGINVLHRNRIGVVDRTGANAAAAIDVVANALIAVSRQRSALGAVQNRIEHTIKNLDNVVENTTQAESTIRDTDMAEEMVKYSNLQILQQAGQSMLAQANQSNQGVMTLLNG